MGKRDSDTSLVVGDVHVSPGQNFQRAVWLGKFIAESKPSRVIFIGDFLTFDSLSAWDKDKRRKMEGRRYAKDIDAGNTFLDIVEEEGGEAYKYADKILTEGNHEYREERYLEYNPELIGQMDYKNNLALCKREVTVVPYKDFYTYKGITFTHVPIMENGRPVSGKYATSRALDVCDKSVVFGHTHKLDYSSVHPHGRPHLKEALNVGCYFEHIDEYAKGSVTSYWRGLVMLDHYKHGRFGYQTIPMGKLKRMYRNERK